MSVRLCLAALLVAISVCNGSIASASPSNFEPDVADIGCGPRHSSSSDKRPSTPNLSAARKGDTTTVGGSVGTTLPVDSSSNGEPAASAEKAELLRAHNSSDTTNGRGEPVVVRRLSHDADSMWNQIQKKLHAIPGVKSVEKEIPKIHSPSWQMEKWFPEIPWWLHWIFRVIEFLFFILREITAFIYYLFSDPSAPRTVGIVLGITAAFLGGTAGVCMRKGYMQVRQQRLKRAEALAAAIHMLPDGGTVIPPSGVGGLCTPTCVGGFAMCTCSCCAQCVYCGCQTCADLTCGSLCGCCYWCCTRPVTAFFARLAKGCCQLAVRSAENAQDIENERWREHKGIDELELTVPVEEAEAAVAADSNIDQQRRRRLSSSSAALPALYQQHSEDMDIAMASSRFDCHKNGVTVDSETTPRTQPCCGCSRCNATFWSSSPGGQGPSDGDLSRALTLDESYHFDGLYHTAASKHRRVSSSKRRRSSAASLAVSLFSSSTAAAALQQHRGEEASEAELENLAVAAQRVQESCNCDTCAVLWNPWWSCGAFLYFVVNPCVSVVALLIAPMTVIIVIRHGAHLFTNLLLGACIIGERPSRWDVVGSAILSAGMALIVVVAGEGHVQVLNDALVQGQIVGGQHDAGQLQAVMGASGKVKHVAERLSSQLESVNGRVYCMFSVVFVSLSILVALVNFVPKAMRSLDGVRVLVQRVAQCFKSCRRRRAVHHPELDAQRRQLLEGFEAAGKFDHAGCCEDSECERDALPPPPLPGQRSGREAIRPGAEFVKSSSNDDRIELQVLKPQDPPTHDSDHARDEVANNGRRKKKIESGNGAGGGLRRSIKRALRAATRRKCSEETMEDTMTQIVEVPPVPKTSAELFGKAEDGEQFLLSSEDGATAEPPLNCCLIQDWGAYGSQDSFLSQEEWASSGQPHQRPPAFQHDLDFDDEDVEANYDEKESKGGDTSCARKVKCGNSYAPVSGGQQPQQLVMNTVDEGVVVVGTTTTEVNDNVTQLGTRGSVTMKVLSDIWELSCRPSSRATWLAVSSGICSCDAALAFKATTVFFMDGLFRLTLFSDHRFLKWTMLAGVGFSVTQFVMFTKALQSFGVVYVVSVRKASLVVVSAIGSVVLFDEKPRDYRLFWLGIFVMVVGISVISGPVVLGESRAAAGGRQRQLSTAAPDEDNPVVTDRHPTDL